MRFKQTSAAGIPLYYPSGEEDTARLVAAACERSTQIIQQRWGLPVPQDCRVYVMTSWQAVLFHAAPWRWKAALAIMYPRMAWRAGSIWAAAGGWALEFGRRKVVCVKSARLLLKGDKRPGEQIFLPGRDANEVIQTITCHELVHACTFHLKLPAWLHEGLATLAMEHYLGRPLVRPDTLEKPLVFDTRPAGTRAGRRPGDQQALLSSYILGYWLTRRIEETKPEILRSMLSRRRPHAELEEIAAAAFGKTRQDFWRDPGAELRAIYR